MKREEKEATIHAIKDEIEKYSNFYITDTSNLTVAQVNDMRRKCFQKGISFKVVKNTLIKKALEASKAGGVDYNPFFGVLKGSSTLMFSENKGAPAKLIKELRKTSDKPILKGAFVDSSVFIGDHQIDALVNLKSKEQLIGEIIGLLQSPIKNVLSALSSGGNILGGIVKTLQERENPS